MSELKELPIGYFSSANNQWYKHVEIDGLDSESLMVLGEKKKASNPYQIFLTMLQKGVISIQNDDGDILPDHKPKIRNMFYKDVLFTMIELVIATKDDSKIITSYKCSKCGEFSTFDIEEDEEGVETDNREDMRKVKINMIDRENLDTDTFLFDVKKGFKDSDGVVYNGYFITYPRIKTYVDVFNYTDNPLEQEREALYRSMVTVNGIDDQALTRLKTKYGRKIFLPNLAEYQLLQKKMRKIGYNLDEHKITCQSCGVEFNTRFDLSNFFASILPV